jgi:stage IV sporulation protein FB
VFFDSQETPYDLRWQMLGTRVRVSPWFWLTTLLLGWSWTSSYEYLFVWIACWFVSILVHEFGHVLMGRAFGSQGHIVLYSLGGLAIGSSGLSNRWQRIAVYLAGPGAGFVLGGLIYIIYLAASAQPDGFRDQPTFVLITLKLLLDINLGWGLVNLLPVFPLDGGQVSKDICDWKAPGGQGMRVAYWISVGLGGALAVGALLVQPPQIFISIMFALLAFSSYQMLQQTPVNKSGYSDDRAAWERDPDAWKRGGDKW